MGPLSTPPERTYTVSWHRKDGERQTCKNLTPRIAFARLWHAWKNSGEITVTEVVPEWLPDSSAKSESWPYPIPPPVCQDGSEDWVCVTMDGTGFWCSACILWAEENAALIV